MFLKASQQTISDFRQPINSLVLSRPGMLSARRT